jgi:hypothetical protein
MLVTEVSSLAVSRRDPTSVWLHAVVGTVPDFQHPHANRTHNCGVAVLVFTVSFIALEACTIH